MTHVVAHVDGKKESMSEKVNTKVIALLLLFTSYIVLFLR